MLSLSVRIVGVFGISSIHIQACVWVWLCSFACSLHALELWRHPKGWAVAYLLPVSLLHPKRALPSSSLHPPPSYQSLFIPFPTYKGVYDSWPWESERLQTTRRESDHTVVWFSIMQTGAFDGQLALSLPKQPVKMCSPALPSSLLGSIPHHGATESLQRNCCVSHRVGIEQRVAEDRWVSKQQVQALPAEDAFFRVAIPLLNLGQEAILQKWMCVNSCFELQLLFSSWPQVRSNYIYV